MTLDFFDGYNLPIFRKSRSRRKGGDSYNVALYRCAGPDEIVWVNGFYYTRPDEYEWFKINKETRCVKSDNYVERITGNGYEKISSDIFWEAAQSVLPLVSLSGEPSTAKASVADDIELRIKAVAASE